MAENIFQATLEGDLQAVKKAVESGTDVNTKNVNGASLLMMATISHNTELIKYLLDNGAEVNTANKMGGTPLMYAATYGNLEAARLYIDKGADVNAVNNFNVTALKIASDRISANYRIPLLLIDKGAQTDGIEQHKLESLNHLASITQKTTSGEVGKVYFDRAMSQVLQNYDGVFLGENHSLPALQQAVTHMMPELKKQGVTTFSSELDQRVIDLALNSNTAEEWAQKLKSSLSGYEIPQQFKPADHFAMIKAAQNAGMTVLGHEDPKVVDTIMNGTFGWSYDPNTHETMKERNLYAAKYIQENKAKDGKILVLGGSWHTLHFYNLNRDEKAEYEHGMGAMLGVPSIVALGGGDKSNSGVVFANKANNGFYVVFDEEISQQELASWKNKSTADLAQTEVPGALQKAIDAVKRLSGQHYLGHHGNDKTLSTSDVSIQIGVDKNWGDSDMKRIRETHATVREALDINQDGQVALEEIREASKQAGIKIDNEQHLVELLNTNSPVAQTPMTSAQKKQQR